MGPKRKTGVAGVYIVRAQRAGKPLRWYIYAWRNGPAIRCHEGPTRPKLTVDDIAAISAAYQDAKPNNQDTLTGLITAYRSDSNPGWRDLAKSTKKLWGDCLDAILKKWGTVPLRLWSDPRMVTKVMTWRDDMSEKPRAADNHVSTLYRLLEYGRLRGKVTVNVAAGIPTLYKGGQRAEIIWTENDFEKVLKSDKCTSALLDVIDTAAMTGLRRSDLVAVDLIEVGEFAIRRTAVKRSAGRRRKIIVPVLPGLAELVERLKSRYRKPGVTTLLVNSFGDSWTPTGLNSSFYTLTRDADITYINEDGKKKHKHLHDLRGTFATKLMTLPGERLTDREIADVMGWSEKQVAEIRRVYVDDAAIVVALGKRLANVIAKPLAKRSD